MEQRVSKFEQRGRKLIGYAARFNEPTDLGEFTEVIRPGAFQRSLAADAAKGIRAIYEHDSKALLGRVGANTLRLSEDAEGLRFEIDLPNTQLGRDLEELVSRGDIAGCSFGFISNSEDWSEQDGKPLRSLTDLDLYEITITATPAYNTTQVAVRSKTKHSVKLKLKRMYLEAIDA